MNADDSQPEMTGVTERHLVTGPDGVAKIEAKDLTLAVEKFKRPRKHYCLIWIRGQQARLCRENETEYRRSGEALAAAKALATEYGARFSAIVR